MAGPPARRPTSDLKDRLLNGTPVDVSVWNNRLVCDQVVDEILPFMGDEILSNACVDGLIPIELIFVRSLVVIIIAWFPNDWTDRVRMCGTYCVVCSLEMLFHNDMIQQKLSIILEKHLLFIYLNDSDKILLVFLIRKYQ